MGGEMAVPKIIDFGLAAVMGVTERRIEPFGTIAYCSPEIVSKQSYSIVTDMWSLGVIFYISLSGYFPFIAKDKKQVVKNILNSKICLS